ncbi:hypothetical protein AC477_01105 [miscellaneous Crenarchaeota group-1 archaeon SG8-32-1]|uniref:Uncharacterized protein n=1 Tax=miscellaneous Crenarchaeota group-1 archaeon SG8-32-1 TaxID=1685124 RepID=A0A0M0BZB5_9ARCH|nr:MAG: hypothetical protein AC477_01105 [miscellaneous Crenarchaeota group-1 archaeon SG8-32-1]
MAIWRWILALLYTFLFTYGLVALLEPGSEIQLGAIAGTVLTLVLSYAPGIAGEYEKLTKEMKQVVNIVLMLIAAILIFVLSCAGMLDVGIVCTWNGALSLLGLLISGLIANQSIYGANKYIAEKVGARVYG